jgi:hypothetical protein
MVNDPFAGYCYALARARPIIMCYRIFMSKQPISVTIEAGNLLWLRNRTAALKRRSVSETLDALIAEARQAGGSASGMAARSVVGTVDINGDDPLLSHMKSYIGDVFDASLSRPVVVREAVERPSPGARKRKRRG